MQRVDSNDSIFLGDEEFRNEGLALIEKVFDTIVNLCADRMDDPDPEVQGNISRSMTLLAGTLVANMELNEYTEKLIGKMIKRAEKCYMKSKRVISNRFLEKTKQEISQKLDRHKMKV